MKEITYQFGTPVKEGSLWKIPINAKSNEPLQIFGINFRFLYDTRLFKESKLGGFKLVLPDGYRNYNSFLNDSPSGWSMFGSTGPISYINTQVEMTDHNKAISVDGEFKTIFHITLVPKAGITGQQFPSFIFDKRIDPVKGDAGMIGQSAGITTTAYLEDDDTGEFLTGPVRSIAIQYNWENTPNVTKYPWGKPRKDFPSIF